MTRASTRYFLFVQFEFTHAIGPHAGRYVVPGATGGGPPDSIDPELDARNREFAGVSRGVGGSDVLVVSVVGTSASAPRGLLRKARPVGPESEPASVPLSVISFVKATEPLDTREAAAGRLDRLRYSPPEQQRWVQQGLSVLNLAIRAYRIGAPDPYAVEVTRRDARSVRIGYGTTEEVQDGRHTDAVVLPAPVPPRRRRVERLRPAEAVAAVLAGHHELLEAEDLLVRALIDLDHDRTRAAAHQAAAALRLLSGELADLPSSASFDLSALAEPARHAEQLADAGAAGPLTADQVAQLESLVDRVGELLDAWREGARSQPA